MQLVALTPAAPLSRFIAAYRFVRLVGPPVPHPAPLLVSPPASEMEIVVSDQVCMIDHARSGEWVPKPRVFVFGPMLAERAAALRLGAGQNARVVSVLFRPGAAAMFLRAPAAAFADLVVDGDDVLPRAMLAAFEQALEARSMSRVASLLDEHFATYLEPVHKKDDPRIEAAVRAIRDAPAHVHVPTLSRQVGLCQRQLERLFLERVGLSPKRYAQLERFRGAARAVAEQPPLSLAELAATLGYADQSHMAREFRALAGVSPSQYAEKRARCAYLDGPPRPSLASATSAP